MKKYFFKYLFFLLLSVSTKAQELPTAQHSSNRVSIDGKPYYIHIVRKGETLSAISRTYKIPIDSIKKDNLNLGDNLKINQYIKVRINEKESKQEYIFHTVKKGDTPTNIAKRYQIKIDDIYKNNSGSELSIRLGENLKIPIKDRKNKKEEEVITISGKKIESVDTLKRYTMYKVNRKETKYGLANKFKIGIAELEEINNLKNRQLDAGELIKIPILKQDTRYHKVEAKETVSGLTRKYDISKRHFYKLNTAVKERGLQIGDWVCISDEELAVKEIQKDPEEGILEEKQTIQIEKKEDEQQPVINEPLSTVHCPDIPMDKEKIYKVAFFFPLFLNVNDTLGKYTEKMTLDENGVPILETVLKEYPKTEIFGKSQLFLKFYEGALLALNDLKKEGMSFEVRVFDTENDSLHTEKLLRENDLSDYDLFIGPFFSAILNIVSDYAWEHQINIVSPLSLKQSFIDHNPYAFQVSPPFEVQMLYASEYLNEFDTKNYIVIHDGKDLNQEYISAFKKDLYAQINDSNYMQVKYNEVFYYEARDSVLKQVFTPGIKNIVVVPSGNQAFVSDVMGKLNGYAFHYDITTFGQPRWISFNNIELEYYHNTNTHIFSNSYIDYTQDDVKKFVWNYRKFFLTEPEKYAFQGYDITKYFCSALYLYGHDFRKCIHRYEPKLLQTHFNFVPYSHQGGYQNTAIYILEYSKENKLIKTEQFPKK